MKTDLYFIFLCLYSPFLIGQTVIKGSVQQPNGDPLVGVNILVKNTQSGTITETEGIFTIAAGLNDTLVFSYVGFQGLQMVIENQNPLDVVLQPNIEFLTQVVVVGYGTQKKQDVTGATGSVSNEDFNGGIINSPEQLIRGKVAGVQLVRQDGEPGAGFAIRIRGASTIRAGNDPLYVVDGYPLDINTSTPLFSGARLTAKNPMEFLNPEDIESIHVLKDASAAAIYGARGANGVILITTKKGEAGRGRFNYATYAGLSWLRKKVDVLSPDAYRRAQTEFNLTGNDFGASTDWQDEVYRTAFTHNHDLALEGGQDQTRYRVALNYHDQEGIIRTNQYVKYGSRINVNHVAIQNRLHFDVNINAVRIRDQRPPRGIVPNTLAQNPTWPIFDETGGYFQPIPQAQFNHPITQLNLSSQTVATTKLLGNLNSCFKIMEGLKYKIQIGGETASAKKKITSSPSYPIIMVMPGLLGATSVVFLSST